MATRKRISWTATIARIEHKGYAAYLAGQPEADNPYTKGYSNQNGPGGQFQRQRRHAWSRGWCLAKEQQQTKRE